MKKTIGIVLKVTFLIIFVLILGLGVLTVVGVLQEKPPGHPLDFQDINENILQNPIHSVEDGFPYALNRALEWRKDVVLTGLQIISVGKKEIKGIEGKFRYRFEFPYIDKTNPNGIMFVSIDTYTNSIVYVSASHGDYKRRINELKLNNLEESINKVYDVAIGAIGED